MSDNNNSQQSRPRYFPELVNGKDQLTVEEWMKLWQPKLPTGAKKYTAQEILSYKDEFGMTNLDRIWSTYDKAEKSQYEQDYNSGTLPYIKKGTIMNVPRSATPLDLVMPSNDGQFVEQTDFEAYWGDNYKSIIEDKEYVPDENVTLKVDGTGINTKMFSLNVRIYMYIKAIDKVLDVSPYVLNLNTGKTKQTGIFSLTLSPFYFNGSSLKFGDTALEQFNVLSNAGALVRDLLEKKVGQNDIVFIRFERLKKEVRKETETSKKIELEIPLSQVAGDNVWDMIGFVDTCMIQYSAEGNSRLVTIQGRDVSKMFTDDGAYFLPLLNINDSFPHWYNEGDSSSQWYKRNIITGMYNYMWVYSFKKIEESIWFIMNVMSNIQIAPNKVFDSWQDKRTTAYTLEGGDVKDMQVNGIWQIVKVFVEDEIRNRVTVDTSIGDPNGTLLDYVGKVCQQPFVEFYFDTYINTIDMIVRQPPFNEKAITTAYKSKHYVTIEADDVRSLNLSYDSRAYSWYQIHLANNHVGNSDSTSLAYVPIVFLNEFTEVFGNKKLEVTDAYLMMKNNEDVNQTAQVSTMQAAALNDLIYLLESNVYLPFTRTGSITLNGDRRIKVGTFVKCELTNEFFYVTSVSNELSFSQSGMSRTTTISVERGMYIPILEGNSQGVKERQDNSGEMSRGVTPSYFKIVDLTELKNSAKQAAAGQTVTCLSPKVDQQQFDFFINRKMFS